MVYFILEAVEDQDCLVRARRTEVAQEVPEEVVGEGLIMDVLMVLLLYLILVAVVEVVRHLMLLIIVVATVVLALS
jgi:hypothetical protein